MSKYLSFVNHHQSTREIFCVSTTILRSSSTKEPVDTITRIEENEVKSQDVENNDAIEKAMNSRRELDEKTAEALHKIQEEDKEKGLGEADAGLG
jgi:hypothetical protein